MRVLLVELEIRLTPAQLSGLDAEGFEVETVGDPARALRRVGEQEYEVIVLDSLRPGEGYQFCESLRSIGIWTPTVILGSGAGDPRQADLLDLGIDDYLAMPFSFVELLARLRILIRPATPERRMLLQVGDLTLNLSQHRVERAGLEIDLTPREFDLLHCLIRNRGNVLTKRQILDDVWEADDAGRANIVEVYVSYLRKKVDRPFDRTMIQTVHGVGYRLSP